MAGFFEHCVAPYSQWLTRSTQVGLWLGGFFARRLECLFIGVGLNMRSRPPVWVMGLGNLPIGIGGAIALITAPQLLAGLGVAEAAIASVTSTMLVSVFTSFLFAPILDWRFSRRAYALALTVLSGVLCFAALLNTDNLLMLALLLLGMGWAINLNNAALGGWFSGLTSEEEKAPLGAWLTVANLVGAGVTSVLAILAIRHLPPMIGPALVSLLFLTPVPLYYLIPATLPDSQLAGESFARFTGDVLSLLGRPGVRWLVFFFLMPAASFAISNTLPGLGRDFGASESFVGVVCGFGVALAGVFGSLVIPPLAKLVPSERLYLLVGAGGAIFTSLLIFLPRVPATFALGIIGENGFWAASFSLVAIIALRSNGQHNPLAATQFALVSAAAGVPLTYMQLVDGHAYSSGGVAGSYAADAAISLAACAILAAALWLRRRPASPGTGAPVAADAVE